jgi:hypothetical protein
VFQVVSCTATSEGAYGAQFWLNAGGSSDAPGTCFIVVVSRTDGSDHSIIDLVIVRMGLKEDPISILMVF